MQRPVGPREHGLEGGGNQRRVGDAEGKDCEAVEHEVAPGDDDAGDAEVVHHHAAAGDAELAQSPAAAHDARDAAGLELKSNL